MFSKKRNIFITELRLLASSSLAILLSMLFTECPYEQKDPFDNLAPKSSLASHTCDRTGNCFGCMDGYIQLEDICDGIWEESARELSSRGQPLWENLE